MDKLQVFNYQDTSVRTVTKDEQIGFVAVDVCSALGLSNPSESLKALDSDEKYTLRISEGGPEANIITEAGLYTLVLRSNKLEAKQFKRWVTHEVLPSIRKHGMYATDDLLNDPDLAIKAFTALKEERERNKLLESKAQQDKPKVEFFEAVASSKDAIEIGQAAKVLNYGKGRNTLFAILRQEGILRDNNEPYQTYIDRGYFRTVEQKYQTPQGVTHINIKTLVYQKGLDYIRKIIERRKCG